VPASGVLEWVDPESGAKIFRYPIPSGQFGVAQEIPEGTPGFNPFNRSHVEAHAAAIMRVLGLKDATLYINEAPCSYPRVGCEANLGDMVPPGARLEVEAPGGFSQSYP
jgi:hypothetical protein